MSELQYWCFFIGLAGAAGLLGIYAIRTRKRHYDEFVARKEKRRGDQ